jgi:hypothetical protein
MIGFPCDHGSDHDVLLWFHLSNNLEHLSSISQRSSSTSIMFHYRGLTPLVSRRYCGIASPFMNPDWCDTFHRFFASTGSGLSSTENTEYLLFTIPFLDVVAIRWHPLKPLDMMCRGPHHPWTFPSVYWIHDEKYHTCPSMICVVIDNFLWLPACQYKLGRVCLDMLLAYHHLFPSICLFNLLVI